MANRTLPFGYRMRSGNIVVVEDEAEIVRMIFASYEGGSSYTSLLRQITSAILLRSNGAVSLKIKNGQIFERSDFT